MASVQTVSTIQLTNNDTVNFYAGTEVLRNVSKVVPNTQTYILRDKENIIILQPAGGTDYKLSNGTSINDPFIFSTLAITKVGGKDYTLISSNDQDAGEQALAKAIDVYNYLVNNIFVGCCECDACGKGCQVQYQWGDLSTGRFIFTSGLLLMDFTSYSSQDLEDLLTALPDGSWVTFLSTDDPTLFSIFEISDLSVISGYAAWTATLVAGQSTYIDNPTFCFTWQPALGGGGGSQNWQETLIEGPNLTQDNTTDGDGFSFTWNNFDNWFLNVIGAIRFTANNGGGTASIFTMTDTVSELRTQVSTNNRARFVTTADTARMDAFNSGTQSSPAFIQVKNDNTALVGGSVGFNGIQYNNDYEANFLNRTHVTKQWVLALAAGVQPDAWKQPCDVATTADITLSGEQTIDGVLTAASRVLVKDQIDQTENGIYISDAGAWTRSTDMDADAEFLGAVVGVTLGTVNANTYWIQETAPVTLGVSNIVFGSFAIPTTFGGAIIDITVVALQGLQATSLVNPQVLYRVTDATPEPCIVFGHSVNSSSALAFLEGESDGTGITSNGGHGTYDLATGVFTFAFLFDPEDRITYIGVNPSDNTNGANPYEIIYYAGANTNVNGDDCGYITYQQEANNNSNGNNCSYIGYGQGSNNNVCENGCSTITYESATGQNTVRESSLSVLFEQGSNNNEVGEASGYVTFEQQVLGFVFGDTFRYCTIKIGLNGRKADDSGPIDFITGVTFLYNRTSPWEIRDIDRTAELIFLYVTYGDGSDPEEGWYDPATDTFTPSGGGSATWGSITGTLSAQTDLQAALDAKQNLPTEVTTSITAANGENYIQTASATYTDPTGVQGQGYEILIVAGTATVGGVAYANTGTKIYRYYNAAAWTTSFVRNRPMPYQAQGQAQAFGTSGGGTRFFNIGSLFAVANTLSTQAVYYFPQGGVFSDFRFETTSAQPATGSLVITLMSGSNPASLTASSVAVTFAAGAAAGVQTSGNTLTISAGDYVCFRAQNNASTNSAGAGNTFINFTANP